MTDTMSKAQEPPRRKLHETGGRRPAAFSMHGRLPLLMSAMGLSVLAALWSFRVGRPVDKLAVNGMVRVGEEALPSGLIRFISLEGALGSAAGSTIREGRYAITARDGLLPGLYAVSITSPQLSERSTDTRVSPPALETIAPEFNVRTTLRVIVRPDRRNVFDFAVQRSPGAVKNRDGAGQ